MPETGSVKLDEKDGKLLEILVRDCKMSTFEISGKTGMPVTTVHNRIKRLEAAGVITGYAARIDRKKLGKNVVAYIMVTVSYHPSPGKTISQVELAKRLNSLEEVEEASIVTGETDIVLKIRVDDIDALNNFIIDRLRKIEGIRRTRTLIALQTFQK